MLDEKRINEIKRRITNFIKERIVKKEKEKKFVKFFLNNAKNSLDSAKLLFEVSTKNDLKNTIGFPDFNGFLWVINSSYYSMFYTARALLENEGIKIKIDVPEINKDAFREAIINAFCHRNYYEYDSVNIAIFKDRLEIRSPGDLYGGLTIEQIKKEKVSKRRNEIIANMFHEVHFVEKWGRGIDLILSKEPDADFKEVAEIFITTFKRKHYIPATTQKTTQKILALIKENPQITRNELAKALRISSDGVKYHLDNLKKKSILKRIGGRKEGHWEILR